MQEQEPKARVLVVDDTPENVDVLAGILSETYRIKVALNGAKALKIAGGDSPPDLILLDVMMPEMDGYEVCQRLRADEKTCGIPIIFVTAKTEIEDEMKGFELGAVDYITKPISPPIVQARVKTQLALKRSRGRMEELSVKLSRYLSPQIYDSIFQGKQDARIGSSRKKLTVFFSDIVGFTAQTESMEPEDLAYVLNSYLNRMARVVLKHGGTLDKFIGDAILVFFGDPETKGVGNDALACVRMALEMKVAVEELRREWNRKGITNGFELRMGITTGYCTVGNFGSNERMDYTIIGNQVNLASRLESNAAPGEILIAEETHTLTKNRIHCLPKEPIRAKGFEHPVPVFQVVGQRDQLSEGAKLKDSRTGFSLTLDPDAISDSDRATVIEKLQAAIASLK